MAVEDHWPDYCNHWPRGGGVIAIVDGGGGGVLIAIVDVGGVLIAIVDGGGADRDCWRGGDARDRNTPRTYDRRGLRHTQRRAQCPSACNVMVQWR